MRASVLRITFRKSKTVKSIVKIGSIILLAAAISNSPLPLKAQGTNQPPAEKKTTTKESGEKKGRALPFVGEITAVDKIGKTISVGKRTFQVTSTTRIAKADKTPTVFEDAKVGEHITGSYLKEDGGKLVAKSIFLGAKPETKVAEKKKAE